MTTLLRKTPIRVGLLGLGTVGAGVYKLLQQFSFIQVEKILVRNARKTRAIEGLNESLSPNLITEDPQAVLGLDGLDVVVEVVGGVDPAKHWVEQALNQGCHVVTANKELMAKHGPALMQLAEKNNVRLLFEGAVAGGIPIIMPLKLSLAANQILEMAGILNGTTNYILTKMSQEGLDFNTALAQAQAAGFAEADPSNDVDGHDIAYKIALLSSIAYRKTIDANAVFRQGIRQISDLDIANAACFNYTLKMIALSRQQPGCNVVDIRVHPMLVPNQHPLASIHNEYNAVWIKGHAVGEVMFSGKGAGEMPTASAVTADILAIANDLASGNDPIPGMHLTFTGEATLQPIDETISSYYIRLNTQDVPGVLGHIGMACGDAGVNVDSMMQRAKNPDGTASIMLITQPVREAQLQQALALIAQHPTTSAICCTLRVLS